MPGLATLQQQQHHQFSYNGFWSKHRDDVSYNQLHKFWIELSPEARQKLLRIEKQTLFEQARRNMYCSRCNGLLLEGFLQIVMYGKSLQHEGGGGHIFCKRAGAAEHENDCGSAMTNGSHDDIQDPSVHPWGGLTTTRDGSLTLLDCYLHSKSLRGLQNVFDSARARERERELLYPDACGGGGRGWISQGIASYGRGHGSRETCALHTARLSCDTLVDFWSALGEETRQSLLRMKEEDFIERLMYRFDSKRFCRDCRRNVIREFKELKELKRMRREPRCTSWFCVADTAFQYEVSDDTVIADWGNTFADTAGAYHHFEWAVGTGEGKSDILEFENVGMNGSVQVSGLQLGGLSACFITLRAWKLDGRCNELSVKAHALKGQQCVHCRLVVGDGFVTINRGESIRKFFEHAEEAEEEEDDDSMDKDGNELDGECSRPQKHAKSPELAREFLLDAATVIFKEQVEKAFREGTARQNAHSIFVCLALKLLEERVHVACKEIITLEKQMKLLEEEEKEKREEEERRERRRTKEREKKLRRKERLKGKERDKERKASESIEIPVLPDAPKDEVSNCIDEEPNSNGNCQDSVSETGNISPCRSGSPDIQDHPFSNGFASAMLQNDSCDSPDGEVSNGNDGIESFTIEQSKFSSRRLRYRKELQSDTSLWWSDRRRFAILSESGAVVTRSESRHSIDSFENSSRGAFGPNRQSRVNGSKLNGRNCGLKLNDKFHCSNRVNDRYDSHTCSCHYTSEYRVRDSKSVSKSESALDVPKQFYRGNRYSHTDYGRETCGRQKSKSVIGNNSSIREMVHSKKVWEPLDTQKKYPRSNSDSDVTLRSSAFKVGLATNVGFKSSDDQYSSKVTADSVEVHHDESNTRQPKTSSLGPEHDCKSGYHGEVKDHFYSTKAADEGVNLCHAGNSASTETSDPSTSSTSNSDNCSSCLSEGDSNTASSSSNHGSMESSSTSDSEDSSQQSEGREASVCIQNDLSNYHEADTESKSGGESVGHQKSFELPSEGPKMNLMGNLLKKTALNPNNGTPPVNLNSQCQGVYPAVHNQGLQIPMFQAPSTMGYYHQNPVSWPAAPANVFMPFPHPSPYLYAGPVGYGPSGNSRFCMQYGPMQHLGAPMFNPSPVPVYHPVAQANGINAEEQSGSCTNQETLNEAKVERVALAAPCPKDTLANGGCSNNVNNSAKMQQSNAGFSLFHFGGPIALTAGPKAGSAPSNDGIARDFSSILSDQVENDPDCNKKETTMEEYNLFAASNGLRFSIF